MNVQVFNEAQQQALLDLLVLAMYADGHLGSAEDDRVRRLLAAQGQTAEYDQATAGQAIATFTDFITLYPDDPRVPAAEKMIAALKTEQAHGNFQIAQFYEKRKSWRSALIYYKEVLVQDPNSPYAAPARERIATLTKRI